MRLAWLKDTRVDLGLIFGVAFLAGGMAGVTVFWPLLFLQVLVLHSWLFGYEHLWATYTRLLMHRDDRAKYQRLMFYIPPVVLLCLFMVGHRFGLTGIYVLYFVGQFHHTVRQSWGFAQQYRYRAGGMAWDNVRWSEITLWSVPVWGILHRANQRPDEFLFQDFWLPPVPRVIVQVAAVASCALVIVWMYTRYAAWRRGELALGHTLYMVSHLVIFFCGYILIDELCSGWLLVNVWHNVQYIAYVWLFNQRRYKTGINPRARLLSWLSQPGYARVTLYFLVTLALALPIYYLLPMVGTSLDLLFKNTVVPIGVILAMTLTFHHYIIDAVVWKRSNNIAAVLSATESAGMRPADLQLKDSL